MKKVGRFSLFELQNNSSVINEESQKSMSVVVPEHPRILIHHKSLII